MLFSSQAFIVVFLPAVLAAYYLAASSPAWRLRVLVLASLLFYGYWDARFVPLLAGSIAGNWLLARAFAASSLGVLVPAGVALNLLLLGVFKYADFFAASVLATVGQTHVPWSVVLPLGISFFTFQQISYLVDLRRGRAPAYPLLHYAAYVTFFPQLIAGPIVRHNELIGQFDADPCRPGLHERLARGLVLFTLGLIKKVFLADEYAPLVDTRFAEVAAGGALGGGDAWFAALAYTAQLYFDFSAYSDMAIGLGLMFGLRLPLNFDAPYRALSIREFWRRWHMTLSSFLRDYVYIPLGGSRQGPARAAGAVLATMLLCGLWHGAGWTFVVWGAAHGVAIVVARTWAGSGMRLPAPFAWALTMGFVIAGWVLFRAADFGVARDMLAAMAGAQGWAARAGAEDVQFLALGLVLALLGPTNVELAARPWIARRAVAVLSAVALVAVTLRVGHGRAVEFIYFQF